MGKKQDVDESATAAPRYPFHARSAAECFKELGCSESLPKEGLTSTEAAARLERYGPNQLTEKEKVTLCQRIWNQVANVLVAVLVFVAIVSLVRAVTSTTADNIVSNAIQVGLIVFVIT